MGMGAGLGLGGSGNGKKGLFGILDTPPAQGQPETIAALREAMAQRPGAGITPDATGANFFAMPQPNTAYGGAFNGLLDAMLARGPEVPPAAQPAAQADPAAGAGGNRAFANLQNAWKATDASMSSPSIPMKVKTERWGMATAGEREKLKKSGATDAELAAFDAQVASAPGPTASRFYDHPGGR